MVHSCSIHSCSIHHESLCATLRSFKLETQRTEGMQEVQNDGYNPDSTPILPICAPVRPRYAVSCWSPATAAERTLTISSYLVEQEGTSLPIDRCTLYPSSPPRSSGVTAQATWVALLRERRPTLRYCDSCRAARRR